jgi:hypothetical protein
MLNNKKGLGFTRKKVYFRFIPPKIVFMKRIFSLFMTLIITGIAHSQNVGIGTPTPTAKLEVVGGVRISDSANIGGQLRLTSGLPGVGKVLTSDANGLASWTTPSSSGVHYIGDSYGGGIVFWTDATGQHGLIAATADQSTSMRWYGGTYTNTMALADGVGAGRANTTIIIANQGYGDGATYAARVCNEYKGGGFGDWYLPSKYELNLLFLQKFSVGGFNISGSYWSSTETDLSTAWSQYFGVTGAQNSGGKPTMINVRAIRAF